MSVTAVHEFWRWLSRDEEAGQRFAEIQSAAQGVDHTHILVLLGSSGGFEFTEAEYRHVLELTDDNPHQLSPMELEEVAGGVRRVADPLDQRRTSAMTHKV